MRVVGHPVSARRREWAPEADRVGSGSTSGSRRTAHRAIGLATSSLPPGGHDRLLTLLAAGGPDSSLTGRCRGAGDCPRSDPGLNPVETPSGDRGSTADTGTVEVLRECVGREPPHRRSFARTSAESRSRGSPPDPKSAAGAVSRPSPAEGLHTQRRGDSDEEPEGSSLVCVLRRRPLSNAPLAPPIATPSRNARTTTTATGPTSKDKVVPTSPAQPVMRPATPMMRFRRSVSMAASDRTLERAAVLLESCWLSAR